MKRWLAHLVFAALCLGLGSLWLLPETEHSLAREMSVLAIGSTVLTLTAGACLLHAKADRAPWQDVWPLAVAGVGLIGLPALLFSLAGERSNAILGTATETAIPVIVAIVLQVLGDRDEGLQQHLLPALLALAGALLVLPVGLPASDRGWTGFALYLAASALVGVSGVICFRRLRRTSLLRGLMIAAAANAVFAGAAWLTAKSAGAETVTGTVTNLVSSSLLPALLAAVTMAALLVSTETLEPIAVSTRFLWVPWIASAEAFLLMRPTLSLRTALGALMMLAGGGVLLRGGTADKAKLRMSLL